MNRCCLSATIFRKRTLSNVDRLRPRLGLSRQRLLVVAGPSGSGKSSLIQAGVIPRLRSGSVDGSARWLIVPTSLDSNPIATIARCISDLRPDGPRPAQVEERLRSAASGLRDVVEELLRATGNPVLLIYVDSIEGLSPAISIDQKASSHNPRSTVGTITEIYDYLRLLFARIGHPHCP